MIRRLIILLLIVGCEEPEDCAGVAGGTAVEDICGVCNGDGTSCYGCTDATACNFDSTATIFDNSCWYASEGCECTDGEGSVADNCETCDIDETNDCVQDCANVWGGTTTTDECGVCDGSGAVEGYNCNGYYLDDINFLQDLYDSSLAWYIANNSSEWFLEKVTSLNDFCKEQVWDEEGRLIELNCSNTMGNSQGYDLKCSIPESIGDVTKLEKLMIIDSHLSGTIPESICNLQNLEWVDLHLNCLLPPYPSCLSTADIGNQDAGICD